MNPILEEVQYSDELSRRPYIPQTMFEGSQGSLTSSRSGIKMGSVSLNHHRLRQGPLDRPMIRPLNPSNLIEGHEGTFDHGSIGNIAQGFSRIELNETFNDDLSDDDEDEESEESDWEREVSKDGSVHFIEPYTEEEATQLDQVTHGQMSNRDMPNPVSQTRPTTNVNGGNELENGKKLSRLVRRRESRRDRNTSNTSVVLKTPAGNEALGQPPKNWRLSNSHESSDNESSTYGQIKTFEAFFQATNLDSSVTTAAPPPPLPTLPQAPPNASPSTKDEVTEIHEVTLKFQAKQLKAQIPHFQMLLHGENPANRGLLLEALLGIIPETKPLSADGSHKSIVDNSLVIGNHVNQAADNVKCGDIIRSLDGHHVTLDTVNTYLLNKLSKMSSSSATGKVKLILQRPMGRPPNAPGQMRTLGPSDLAARREAMSANFSQLDDHSFHLLANANVMAAIISNDDHAQSESSDDAPSVMYAFPNNETDRNPLLGVRGIFSTLVQLLPDIVSEVPTTSSLLVRTSGQPHSTDGAYSSQEQHWMHVSYAAEGDDILFLGLPGTFFYS